MITFDPPLSVGALGEAEPGSLVRWGANAEHVGFAVRSTNDADGAISLVAYDPVAHRFKWEYADAQMILRYTDPVIVKPDVTSFFPSFVIGLDPSLYWLDGVPYVSVQLNNNRRFLDLASGELKSRQSWPMVGGFRAWVAGVRGVTGDFHGLIAVSAPP